MSRAIQERARLGYKSRHYPQNHPEVIDARRALAEAKIADYIERTLAEAPPLTDRQRTALAELLRPVRIAVGGELSV
jgi:hypothetical protein